jgi:dienelactone hydrolase
MAQFLSLLLCLTAFLTFLAGSAAHPKSTNNDKPAIILVPAAFSKAAVYDNVKDRLSNLGYDVVAIDLPSVGQRAAYVDRTPDIKEVQKHIGRMLHQGKNVS